MLNRDGGNRRVSKLAATSLTPEVRKPQARSRLTNGKDILPGIDGRSVVARRYHDLVAQLVADAGGAERLSEVRAQLIRRFAALAVQAEAMEAQLASGQPIDLGEHALVSSTLVRISTRLGIERRAREITPRLQDYLANRAKPNGGHRDDP